VPPSGAWRSPTAALNRDEFRVAAGGSRLAASWRGSRFGFKSYLRAPLRMTDKGDRVKGRARELFLVISGALLLCTPHVFLATQDARLSGWTLTDDGLPLSAVEVVLACPPAPVRRTVSDDRGHFELPNLPAGNCRLWGTKPGYVDANIEGDPYVQGQYNLKVLEGAWRDGFELRLARGVILTGRITVARGRPWKKTRVHPIRREVRNGVTRLVAVPYRQVSLSGAFEFPALPPGEYYIGASPIPAGHDAGGASGYAITYFPGTTKFAEAKSIAVKAGESRQVNFALAETQAFRVSGSPTTSLETPWRTPP
jgi:hypothetical protein